MMESHDAPPRGVLRVLFVEDSPEDATLLARHLQRAGYHVESFRVDTVEDFENAIINARWDLVISDHSMPHFSSTEALRLLKAREVDCPFIIVSGTIGEDMAVEAMRAGAHDYVLKHNLARLAPAIERELGDAELRRQARDERVARQAVERQLQQSQKMEAVGRLAGGVAHDFNNLLTAILGFAGLGLDKVERDEPGRFELEQVKLAAERAARFTKQLLAFSRQQVLSPRLLDPGETIDAMLPLLRQLLGEDIELSLTARPRIGQVRVDPGQFEQVIMNLAVNARDAMPNGGQLTLSAERVDVDATDAERLQLKPGPYTCIAITDTGIGMDDATRLRIFEPFFTTKPPGKGTGLGLSTVYGILQQSGGAIDVETALASGTTFRVYLPVAEQVAMPAPAPRPAPRADKTAGVIFLAEDEEAVRLVVRTVLTNAGFQLLEASSGTEAAALVEKLTTAPDLLITDVVMPGMLGPDLARIMTQRFPQTRVLYITGYATHSAIPPSFVQEEDAILQKPFVPEQLLARVYERLGLTT